MFKSRRPTKVQIALLKHDEAILASAEFQRTAMAAKLNWLRAGVLGANDGIVSTAGLVMGVAGANGDAGAILIAGVAGLVAGSISMAGGEYTSVSAQRDSELAALEVERKELILSLRVTLLFLLLTIQYLGGFPNFAGTFLYNPLI
jgi:hypothetical protein